MSDQGIFIFVGLVFVAVFFLANGLVVPVFGENRQARKRLKERLDDIDRSTGAESMSSILRERYLRDLSPMEQSLAVSYTHLRAHETSRAIAYAVFCV